MIVLVTGVPGVGKTSLCRFLVDARPHRYVHIRFGNLILRALDRDEITETELRRSAASLVTPSILEVATEMLMAEVAKNSERIILVDSHAVSQNRYGYVVTPDGASYFGRLRYAAIVQLFALPSTVLARSAALASGRQASVERDVNIHFMLQCSVSVGYSAASECPLLIVEAEKGVDRVAANVESLLSDVLEGS
jgi:adenylate kinase